MATLQTLALAPLALGSWLGFPAFLGRDEGVARIFMLHGTPASEAKRLLQGLQYLQRHFQFVSLDSICSSVRDGAAGLTRRVALTFDDGLRDNVEVAYPILKRMGIPATFFVCPRLIGSGRWLWNHEARQRLLRLDAPALASLAMELGAPQTTEAFIDWMKALGGATRRSAEEAIRRATARFCATPEEHRRFDLADWPALRQLDPKLVTIGSHTRNHAILPTLGLAEAEAEISGSRRDLERMLQRTVDQFAYPNGAVDGRIRALAMKHYAAAVSVEEGCVTQRADCHLLPRLNMQWNSLKLALSVHRHREPPGPSSRSRDG